MTGFEKGPLWTSPERVAAGSVRALDRKSPSVHLPGLWRPIMFVVRAIPEHVFARLTI
jgi:short-subunit dehydrogenase